MKNTLSTLRAAAIGLALVIAPAALFTSCWEDLDEVLGKRGEVGFYTFDSASTPGDPVKVSVGDIQVVFRYTNNQESVTFPIGAGDISSNSISTKFFMAETEVTWELWKAVYDWAIHVDRGVNIYTFANAGRMGSVEDGTGMTMHHPVTMVSWRDAVVWCNALSEMTGTEVVYINNSTSAVLRNSTEAVESLVIAEETTFSRKGYRLPSTYEWEYTARYRGNDSTNTVGSYSNPYFTKGNSASGATTFYNDTTGAPDYAGKLANDEVAVYGAYYNGSTWDPTGVTSTAVVKSKGVNGANALFLYDMNGNVWEWCFTKYNIMSSNRIIRGGSWRSSADSLQGGYSNDNSPTFTSDNYGLRIVRTQ